MTRYCPKFRRHALSSAGELVRMRCKSWDCPYCARVNRAMWQMHLKRELGRAPHSLKRWSFMTITAPAWAHAEHKTAEVITRRWDALMKRLKRAWGAFSYVRVYEMHASGEQHAHALVSVWSDDYDDDTAWRGDGDKPCYRGVLYKTLHDAVTDLGLGYICDIRPVRPPANADATDDDGLGELTDKATYATNRVVAYVTKYMTKLERPLPRYTRRVQTSRDIRALNMHDGDDDANWVLTQYIDYEDVASAPEARVIDVTRKVVVKLDWFDDAKKTLYPQEEDF